MPGTRVQAITHHRSHSVFIIPAPLSPLSRLFRHPSPHSFVVPAKAGTQSFNTSSVIPTPFSSFPRKREPSPSTSLPYLAWARHYLTGSPLSRLCRHPRVGEDPVFQYPFLIRLGRGTILLDPRFRGDDDGLLVDYQGCRITKATAALKAQSPPPAARAGRPAPPAQSAARCPAPACR